MKVAWIGLGQMGLPTAGKIAMRFEDESADRLIGVALLTEANESRLEIAAVISVQLGAYFQETGTTPADLREKLLGDRPSAMAAIIRRAAERGPGDRVRRARPGGTVQGRRHQPRRVLGHGDPDRAGALGA